MEVLPLEKIRPAVDNVRVALGDLEGLAASIRSEGLLQPLLVRPAKGGMFELVDGHRRYHALKLAEISEAECSVRSSDVAGRVAAMLVANIQREDLTPLEEAQAMARLVEECALTQTAIAARLGCTQAQVSKRLSLLKLPDPIRDDLHNGGISVGAAQELTRLVDHRDHLYEAYKAGKQWGDMGRYVAAELRAIETEAKVFEAREKLASKGVKEVDYNSHSYTHVGTGYTVDMSPSRHAKEPCHAAVISPYSGQVTAVCVEPARHGASVNGRASKADANEKAKRAELRAAAKARRQAIADTLAGRVPRDRVVDHLISVFVATANAAPTKIACELLGLDTPKDALTGRRDYRGALAAHIAGAGADTRAKAALALALAHGEEQVSSEWASWRDDTVAAHFDFLEAGGYEPAAIENNKLGRKAKPTRPTKTTTQPAARDPRDKIGFDRYRPAGERNWIRVGDAVRVKKGGADKVGFDAVVRKIVGGGASRNFETDRGNYKVDEVEVAVARGHAKAGTIRTFRPDRIQRKAQTKAAR